MIYLKETFNLTPASPETRDHFIEFAQSDLMPAYRRLGARLVAAWFSHTEWYGQITQVLAFDSLSGFEAFSTRGRADAGWQRCLQRVEQFAPQRRGQLLEPLGPIAPDALDEAIRESQQTPLNSYTFAVLGGRCRQDGWVHRQLDRAPRPLSHRRLVARRRGQPQRSDRPLEGALGQEPYQAANERMKAFCPLREMAPCERLVNLYSVPYSPLR